VPADARDQVDHLASVADAQAPVLGVVARQPADGGVVKADRVVVADQQEQGERVREVDVAELRAAFIARKAFPVLRARWNWA
jgi:hypothetical protein